jgi:hypothetical protein
MHIQNDKEPKIADAVRRIKRLFLEVPGTQLSLGQAVQLSGLEPTACASVLAALEDAKFLNRDRDGHYLHRRGESPAGASQPAARQAGASSPKPAPQSSPPSESAPDLVDRRQESRMNRIARRAHEIYISRGGEHGKALQDWLEAERQIDGEDSQD